MDGRGKLGFDLDGVLYPWHEVVLEDLIQTGVMPKGSTVGGLFNFPNGAFHTFRPNLKNGILKNSRHYIRPFLRDNAKQILNHLQIEWEKDHLPLLLKPLRTLR